MRELLRGYATAALQSASAAGRLPQVADDLAGFARALVASDELRNVLTDPNIPTAGRRGVVVDLLHDKAAPESEALVAWTVLVEPAGEFAQGVAGLVEMAEATVVAVASGDSFELDEAGLAGGRTAVRERLRGYADRLFQEAPDLAVLDEIEDELFRFARIVADNPRLRRSLGDPLLPPAQRSAIVRDLLATRCEPATVRLTAYLVAAHVRDLVGTIEWLAQLAAEERGRRVADVRSAVDLDESERGRLAEALARSVGHPVEVRVLVDPAVLGGMTVAIGDTVIDGSVRHRLEQLRESIASGGVGAGPSEAATSTTT